MCGICGIYNLNGQPVDNNLLRRMNNTLVHRGPDEEGYFINAGRRGGEEAGRLGRGNVGLGHRRLSILDLSTGQQPLSNEDGSIWTVFNGEIYNYRILRDELIKKGHTFQTRSDTEVIVHLYEEKGDTFLSELRGMFAIALWDNRKKSLLLARDRVGKKPIYYFADNERLVFASELKALLCDPTISKDIDLTALSDYFSFLYVPAPKTIFKEIKKLEPGTYAIFGQNGVKKTRYWNLSCQASSSSSLSSCISTLKDLFQDCVRCRLESEVPLGAFLSGGIDSSGVVAGMAALLDAPVNTTSIGFQEQKFNELPYSRQIAQKFKTSHHEYILEPDFIKHLPAIVWHLDEPFADSSALPTYLLCQMTRQNVTVALSGDGGDENFAGYTRYSSAGFENRFRFIPEFLRMIVLKPILRFLPDYMRGYNFLENLTVAPEQAMANTFFCYDERYKRRLFSQSMNKELSGYSSFSVVEQYFRECDSDDPITRLQYVDLRTYLPEDILMKVDKMSMAHSLEVRAPFLDHRMVELAFSMPSAYKLNGSEGKYILKKMLNDYLPPEILYRKKSGFSVPIDFWFRDKLKGLMHTVLFDKRTVDRGYFNPAFVGWLWDRYQSHPFYQIDLSHHLWVLFVFELWNRIYVDGQDYRDMCLVS